MTVDPHTETAIMPSARFRVGEVVRHRLYDYRGVVYDMDAAYSADAPMSDAADARSRRDQPWYRVLVDDADHAAYVAEQNLEPASGAESEIRHPELGRHFQGYADGVYRPRAAFN